MTGERSFTLTPQTVHTKMLREKQIKAIVHIIQLSQSLYLKSKTMRVYRHNTQKTMQYYALYAMA